MPIKIYPRQNPSAETAWLCDNDWSLPRQAAELQRWLVENKTRIKPDHYVVDIGFSIRKDADTGGADISPEAMRTMADLGMHLFLSEYS